jgi:hypothetical protein
MEDDNKQEEYNVKSSDVIETLKKLLREGNIRKITVRKKNGDVIASLPITFGLIGVMVAPFLALVGAAAALLTECKITVERDAT